MTFKQSFKFFFTFTLFSIFISCSNNKNELSNNKNELRYEVRKFLEKSYPAILQKQESLIKTQETVNIKIDDLEDLKKSFPAHFKRIDPYISRWHGINDRLKKSLNAVILKTNDIYIMHRISGINSAGHLELNISAYDSELDKEINGILNEIEMINKAYASGEELDISQVETKAERERFTIRKNVFIDNKTGYMWEKKAVKGGLFQRFLNENINSYDEVVSFIQTNLDNGGFQDYWDKNTMNWHEAKNYCENLVLDGYSDWKLPSRDEFHTLMTASYGKWDNYDNVAKWFNENRYKRNSNLFLPKELVEFFGFSAWTRDISKTDTSFSWRLNFNYGNDGSQGNNYLFRCIRNNQ
jgi:hypothetical protein